MASFMRPFTTKDRFARIDDENGETVYFGPASDSIATPDGGERTETEGWYARLSAPGYMDCTDWDGPHPSEEAALASLASTLDLCPHCFEQCWESADGECEESKAEDAAK